MPRTETYECDACGEGIHLAKDVVEIKVNRAGDTTTSFVHDECLEEAMSGNEFLESVVLHD